MNSSICNHLAPFLKQLTEQGSSVVEVNEDLWSNCALSVALDQGPSIMEAEGAWEMPDGVKLWHNDDTHYAIENGLFCESCKHSLSWPRVESERAMKS